MELYIKVISLGQGVAYNRKRKSNTYGWSRLLVVLKNETLAIDDHLHKSLHKREAVNNIYVRRIWSIAFGQLRKPNPNRNPIANARYK